MKTLQRIAIMLLSAVLASSTAQAQPNLKPGDNAALRYWSAFARMQDAAVTDEQAKELTTILDGTSPYVDSKYKELVEKNRPALETMARGTALPYCDWGVDLELGDKTPVDYARKAAALGRLNILYTFHLLIARDKDGAVRALQAGLRFSHDVANGGTLFATLVSKGLMVMHLRATADMLHLVGLSGPQRSALLKSVTQLGEGLDWPMAMKRELEIRHTGEGQGDAPRARITASYMKLFSNPGTLPELQQMIASAPAPLPEFIPNPKHVLQEQQELTEMLQQTKTLLQ